MLRNEFLEYQEYRKSYDWVKQVVTNNKDNNNYKIQLKNLINNLFRLYVDKFEDTTYEEYGWKDYNELLKLLIK